MIRVLFSLSSVESFGEMMSSGEVVEDEIDARFAVSVDMVGCETGSVVPATKEGAELKSGVCSCVVNADNSVSVAAGKDMRLQ